GNGTQFSRVGLVGGYLTGAATGAPGVNSEQQEGQQSTTQTLALTPVSGGIRIWGFAATASGTGNLTPKWANLAASSSDEYVTGTSGGGFTDLAVNHAAGTGSSITAQVTPNAGGAGYDFISGLVAAGWSAAAAGAAPNTRTLMGVGTRDNLFDKIGKLLRPRRGLILPGEPEFAF